MMLSLEVLIKSKILSIKYALLIELCRPFCEI